MLQAISGTLETALGLQFLCYKRFQGRFGTVRTATFCVTSNFRDPWDSLGLQVSMCPALVVGLCFITMCVCVCVAGTSTFRAWKGGWKGEGEGGARGEVGVRGR